MTGRQSLGLFVACAALAFTAAWGLGLWGAPETPSQGPQDRAGKDSRPPKPPAEEGSVSETEEGAPAAPLPGAEDEETRGAEAVARGEGLRAHPGDDASPQGDTELTWVLLEHTDSQMDDPETTPSRWTLTAESEEPREIQIHQHHAVQSAPGWSLALVKRRDRDWIMARPPHIRWRLIPARGRTKIVHVRRSLAHAKASNHSHAGSSSGSKGGASHRGAGHGGAGRSGHSSGAHGSSGGGRR
jgi:hypothetical protein